MGLFLIFIVSAVGFAAEVELNDKSPAEIFKNPVAVYKTN